TSSAQTSSETSSAVSSQPATTTGSTDLFTYEITDSVITITKYKGALTDVIVPAVIDSKTVGAIGASAFAGTGVVSVSIESGIASVGEKAFSNCTALEFISVPASVTSIAADAFEGSANARIAAPSGSAGANLAATLSIAATYPYEIDNGIYQFEVYDSYAVILACKSTEAEITVPTTLYGKTVTVINSEAFKNLTSLTKVTLPENLTALLSHAFIGCTALQTVVFPAGVITIGEDAFDNCPNVKIEAPADSYAEEYSLRYLPATFVRNASADGFNYAVYTNQVKITAYIGTATAVTVPTRLENLPVTAIETKAFINNMNVTSIAMSDKIYAIGSEAFSGCTALTSIHLSNALCEIPDKLFYNCTSLATVNIPSKLTDIGDSAFYRCAITSVALPSTVKTIGDSAFYECSKLTTVSISEGLINIGNYAFSSCSVLTSIILPRSLQYLGTNAFSGCTVIHIYAYTGSAAASMLTAMSIPFTALA
ncbi:MAG TPA: leucine-rich repeat protein, partial [Clostridiales bacterium]|nr:leucine-rich repeat protein [Clostridiales bacterium]